MADATLPVVIFASFVMFLGVIGNSLVCYICLCRLRRSVLNNFVLSLAALDLMGCVLCVPMEITELRNRLLTFDPALCISQRFFRNVHIICSVFVLVAIATERFRRICNPLSRHITLRQGRVAVVTALILAVLLSWPSLFIFGGRVTTFKTEAVPVPVPALPVPSSSAVTSGHVRGGGGEVNGAVVDGGTEGGRISPTLFSGESTAGEAMGRNRINDSSTIAGTGRGEAEGGAGQKRSADDDASVTVVVVESTECAVKDSMKGSVYPVIYFSVLFLLFFASSAVLCGLYARIACSIWRPRKLRTDTRTKSASLPDCRRLNAVFNNNNNHHHHHHHHHGGGNSAAIAAIKAFHANQRSLRPGGGIRERSGSSSLCNGGSAGRGGDGGDDADVPLTASDCRRQNPETVPLTEVGGERESEETAGLGQGGENGAVSNGGSAESPTDDAERRRDDVTLPRQATASQRLNAVFSAMTLPFKGRRDRERSSGNNEAADGVGAGGKDGLSRGIDTFDGDVTLPRLNDRRRLNYSIVSKTSSLLRGAGRRGTGGRGDANRNSSGGGGSGERGISNNTDSGNAGNHTSTLPMPRRLYDELTRSLQLRRKRESTALSAMNVNANNYYNSHHNYSTGAGGGNSHINNLLLVVPTLSFRRKKRAAYSRKRTTFIMFLMTLTSVVSYLPFVLVSIAYVAAASIGSHNNSQQPWGQRSVAERAIIDLCLKSFLISSAVNPLIYGFCNQHFKKECHKILEGLNRCRRRKIAVETEDTSDTPANT